MKKKGLLYILCGIAVLAVLVVVIIVSNSIKSKKNNGIAAYNGTSDDINNISDNFVYDNDGKIMRLSEIGKKQKSIVIPAEVDSDILRNLSFSDSVVENVRFESDNDIDFGATFTTCSTLRNIILPANLTTVTFMAFGGCSSLESITIPANVTDIKYGAFENCSKLKEIKFIGNKCETIEEHAFDGCGFVEISLPEGLKNIEKKAFFGCKKLEKVTLPSTVKNINQNAFNVESLSEVHFDKNITQININPTAFSIYNKLAAYIGKDSWMDRNRESWSSGFANILYE